MAVLSQRLVAIYESGSPDMLNAILESEDWDQMAAQTEYLRQIQEYDDAVVNRVKSLRDQVRSAVARLDEQRAEIEEVRDAVATKEREAAAASQAASARFHELKAEQAERQEALDALQSRESALSDNLSVISEQVASEGGDATTGQLPAPLNGWIGSAAGDRILRSVKLFAEILKDVGGSLESSARCRRAAQRSDLLTHGELVARKITCELRDLCRDHATDEKDACEREQDDTDD